MSNSTNIALPQKATIDDIQGIAELLKAYAEMGNLLPRTDTDIENNIDDFWVINNNQTKSSTTIDSEAVSSGIIACGALEQFTDELIEIRSLVVNPDIQGSGLGRLMVEALTTAARERGAKRLMALTYSVGFFEKLGFEVVKKDIFPEKIWSICINCYKFNNCDEIAVVKYL